MYYTFGIISNTQKFILNFIKFWKADFVKDVYNSKNKTIIIYFEGIIPRIFLIKLKSYYSFG